MRLKKSFSRKSVAALSLAIASAAGGGIARAANVLSTWTDGAGGSTWGTAGNWTNSDLSLAFPNNAGSTTYDVVVGSPAPTNVNGNFTIDNLTVTPTGTVVVQPAQTLTVIGPTLANDGLIQIDTLGSNAALNFGANTLLTGSGRVMLDDYSPNARLTGGTGVVVTQNTNSTIDGVGEIDVAMINKGTINADFNAHTLFVLSPTIANSGTLEASPVAGQSATLQIGPNTVINNAGGSINEAAGGTVNLMPGSSVSGGTINGGMNVFNGSFSGVTISTGTLVYVEAGNTLTVTGPTLTNNGTIQVSNIGAPSTVNFTSNTLLTGSGNLLLDTYSPDAQMTGNPGVVVTQAAAHTIHGTGDIDVALVNNGIVNADIINHQILLQTSNMTNNNLFEATNNGSLNISGITVTQSSTAQIVAGGNGTIGTVNISNGATITGGTLSGIGAAGQSINVTDGTFGPLTIASGTQVFVPGGTLTVTGPTLTNNGTIQLSNLGLPSTVNFTNNTLLTGAGTLFLDTYSPDAQMTGNAGVVVTQSPTHTIHGIGAIDVALINNGVVNADQTVGTKQIALQTSNMTNNNVFEATNGGVLSISGITVTQSPTAGISTGVVGSLGSVNLSNGAKIVGGTISGPGTFTILSDSTFGPLTISTGTPVQINPGQTLTITGPTLTNNGTITVDTLSSNATLNFAANTLLTGSGAVTLNDYRPNARMTGAAGVKVTQDVNHTINGVGEVDVALINNGTVNGSYQIANPLFLQTSNMTNNAVFEAIGGGLTISGITVTQGAGGQIIAGNGTTAGTVAISSGATIVNGTLNSTTLGTINVTSGTLTNVTITPGSQVSVFGSGNLSFTGTTLTDNGTLAVNGGTATGSRLTGTGALTVQNFGTLKLAGLTAASTLGSVVVGSGGTLDVTNNKLVINYGTPASDPVAAIVANLTSGRNNGPWNGTGITSSTAAAAPTKFAVGYSDGNTDPASGAAANQLVLKYTLAGDANLDNSVGFPDLLVVAQNYGSTGKDWAHGNFNYDPTGLVGFPDLLNVAQNYGFTTGINEGLTGGGFSPAFQLASSHIQVTSVVPEPSALALGAMGAGLLARRRRARTAPGSRREN